MRVFLCHASEDKSRVRELWERLRRDGFEAWLDTEQLLPGQDWEFEISAAVKSSDVVIVCLSALSVVKTGYVQKELRRVLEAAEYQPEGRIFVIPVRLDECEVPNRLSQWQYADLFVPAGYDRLCSALRARAKNPHSPLMQTAGGQNSPSGPQAERFKPARRKRTLPILAGSVLAVAACGLAIGIFMKSRVRHADLSLPTRAVSVPKQDQQPPGMARISTGRFLMGRNGFRDNTASPAHEVIVQAFYLDVLPVTNGQFHEFLQKNKPVSEWAPTGTPYWPATGVTWDDADAYCLTQQKRLPTEAEWEFAARGVDGRLYPWGEVFDPEAANYEGSKVGHAEPVGTRALNRSPFGLADMSGNVWQWCEDDYQPYRGSVAFPFPLGAKVLRGGSYQSDALHVTSVNRNLELPSKRSRTIGFRCAK